MPWFYGHLSETELTDFKIDKVIIDTSLSTKTSRPTEMKQCAKHGVDLRRAGDTTS